jgi:hypothetical protein
MSCEEMCDCKGREGYPIVLVDWTDSAENEDNADVNIYDLPEPQRIFQAGFIVNEQEDYIVVAGGLKPAEESFDYCIAIPRCSIIAIRYLEPVERGTGAGDS